MNLASGINEQLPRLPETRPAATVNGDSLVELNMAIGYRILFDNRAAEDLLVRMPRNLTVAWREVRGVHEGPSVKNRWNCDSYWHVSDVHRHVLGGNDRAESSGVKKLFFVLAFARR